ncbi:MAG: hypothetical protein EOP21_05760 [Hyphomicrobiales bacterium]|nr:MAG: hypothetical protein EOP21_05760 [Hyphomicrobiales bacterium]
MLLLLTTILLTLARSEDTAVNQYAQCAFIAGMRAQAADASEAEKKAWRERARKYLDKVVALAFSGKTPTHAQLDAIINKASDSFEDKMKDMDGDEMELMFSEHIMMCDV